MERRMADEIGFLLFPKPRMKLEIRLMDEFLILSNGEWGKVTMPESDLIRVPDYVRRGLLSAHADQTYLNQVLESVRQQLGGEISTSPAIVSRFAWKYGVGAPQARRSLELLSEIAARPSESDAAWQRLRAKIQSPYQQWYNGTLQWARGPKSRILSGIAASFGIVGIGALATRDIQFLNHWVDL